MKVYIPILLTVAPLTVALFYPKTWKSLSPFDEFASPHFPLYYLFFAIFPLLAWNEIFHLVKRRVLIGLGLLLSVLANGQYLYFLFLFPGGGRCFVCAFFNEVVIHLALIGAYLVLQKTELFLEPEAGKNARLY